MGQSSPVEEGMGSVGGSSVFIISIMNHGANYSDALLFVWLIIFRGTLDACKFVLLWKCFASLHCS